MDHPLHAHTVRLTSGPGDRLPSARAGQSPPFTLGVLERLVWEPRRPVTGPVLLEFSSQTSSDWIWGAWETGVQLSWRASHKCRYTGNMASGDGQDHKADSAQRLGGCWSPE